MHSDHLAHAVEKSAVDAEVTLNTTLIDESGFRRILGQFATGVTVVTMVDAKGQLSGFTANSFSSVSLDPPLVLVCVSYEARSYEHLRDQQAFTVHILDGDQRRVAHRFATPGLDRSAVCDWHVNERGFAVLSKFHAALECRLYREYDGGDHAIVLGRVERLYTDDAGTDPLISYRGQLFPLGREYD